MSRPPWKLVFFDTETTGLPEKEPFRSNPKLGPEIVEYAIADWSDGEVTNIEHKLIWPYNAPEPDAEGICRTTDGYPLRFRKDEWGAAKAVKWNLADSRTVLQRFKGHQLAGSNPAYDMALVRFEQDRIGQPWPQWSHRKVDTAAAGVWLYIQGVVEQTGLVALAKHFGIEHDAHTAMGDVLASIKVFERLIDEFVLKPKRMREALAEIVEHSPDASMADFAREALEE